MFLSLALGLSIVACGSGTEAGIGYKPPLIPLQIKIGLDGSVSFELNKTIVTPIGTFSLEAGIALHRDVPQGSTLLIIRHRQAGVLADDLYEIHDENVTVTVNGLTTFQVSNGRIFVDASSAELVSAPGKTTGTAVTQTPPPPQPTTPRPKALQHLTDLVVPSTAVDGLQYPIARAGTYRFAYRDGAYSAWPDDRRPADPSWQTTIVIYRSGTAPRDGVGLDRAKQLFALADYPNSDTQAAAIKKAKGLPNYYDVDLNAGEIVTLVVVDDLVRLRRQSRQRQCEPQLLGLTYTRLDGVLRAFRTGDLLRSFLEGEEPQCPRNAGTIPWSIELKL